MEKTKIAVVGGLGRIGLVQAACLAEVGYETIVCDNDREKLKVIEREALPYKEAGLEELVLRNLRRGQLRFTHLLNDTAEAEVVYVCVSTPSLPSGEADTSRVEAVVEEVAQLRRRPCLVVIRSTVPVGTARKLSASLAGTGLAGTVTLVSNPEFLREGTAVKDFWEPARIVVGAESPAVAEKAARIYSFSHKPIISTTWENAELIKYVSNAFLALKISFINEIACFSEKSNCDIRVVKHGIGLDPRIGMQFLDAGVGFSGPCLEKDLRALVRQFAVAGVNARILEAVWDVNQQQRENLIQKLALKLGGLERKKIAVLGLAFKPGTDDVRNSLSLPVIRRLIAQGAEVTVHDPWVPDPVRAGLNQEESISVTRALCPYEAASRKDGLLILTDWPQYRELDLERLAGIMSRPVIIDGRNLFQPLEMAKLGIDYQGVGI